ncbi:hypothetical protein CDAR_558401 [Caerostris darwini]|uniref:Uncharacterized protein n=1 Tax=Caerostris darwini TaxID=1538125 RepID=A0AAV4UPP3_9ARAC|nr:hypothetical protein CDAR_558401 [Caerostris darwini]
MILDQLKKKVSPQATDHFIDVWYDNINPEELIENMDFYDNLQTSNVQRENSHDNNKCYPKQSEYRRYDKKHIQKFLKWKGIFNGTEPIKEALPKMTVKRLSPGFPIKVSEISSTWRDPFLHVIVAERLE